MSASQLEAVIADVSATFNRWGPATPIGQIREDWDNLFANVVAEVRATAEPVSAGGVKAEWICAPDAGKDRTILYLHGGGYVLGSVRSHRDICERLSRAAAARVLALDYRLAPKNPFPAAVEDAVAAYEWLLGQGVPSAQIAISGDSAGGGLTLATLLALKATKRPLPGCAAVLSPWVDMELLGESLTTNDDLDPMVHKAMATVMVETFLQGADPRNPLANPLYGDFTGLPPLLIHVGVRETLLSDSLRVAQKARAAGVKTELKVWDGQVHVFQIFASRLDEGEAAVREIGGFIDHHLTV